MKKILFIVVLFAFGCAPDDVQKEKGTVDGFESRSKGKILIVNPESHEILFEIEGLKGVTLSQDSVNEFSIGLDFGQRKFDLSKCDIFVNGTNIWTPYGDSILREEVVISEFMLDKDRVFLGRLLASKEVLFKPFTNNDDFSEEKFDEEIRSIFGR